MLYFNRKFCEKSTKLLRVGVGISGKEAQDGSHTFLEMHKSKYLKRIEEDSIKKVPYPWDGKGTHYSC